MTNAETVNAREGTAGFGMTQSEYVASASNLGARMLRAACFGKVVIAAQPETVESLAIAPAARPARVQCGKCGLTVSAKKDGSPRQHAGFINVCGVTMRKIH